MHGRVPEAERIWSRFADRVRAGDEIPFADHWQTFLDASGRLAPADGPLAVWRPDERAIARSNLGRLMAERGVAGYPSLHRWSVEERGAFWEVAARSVGVVWARAPRTMLDLSAGTEHAVWAAGSRLNVVESCGAGLGDEPAIVVGRENGDDLESISYRELLDLSARCAAGLHRLGCRPGDAVALYMPMTVECVAAYLGIVRAGCSVVSIADSFSAPALSQRLGAGNAVALVTVDAFERAGKRIDLMAKVREADAPRAIVVRRAETPGGALRDGDLPWDELVDADASFAPVHCDPEHTINVLFSSGTTGEPKAIPWTQLTPIKCAVDGRFHQDIRRGDVVAWPTNVGWMMGPWLIFATLMNGATMALYEGAPGGTGFVRFVERAQVDVLGLVPSLVRAWRALAGGWCADWSGVRLYSSTGEPSSREDYLWLMSRSAYRAPVIEYCGGTEIGGAYLTGTVVQPASPATFTTPALGLDLAVLDHRGRPVEEGRDGEVFLLPPSIGLSQRLLNRDHHEAYYAGTPPGPRGEVLRRHGDRLTRLAGGHWRAQGRTDDTMNLGGIKVASLEIERVLGGHEALRECAAVGVQTAGEGVERLVVFAVPEPAAQPTLRSEEGVEELRRALEKRIARELNPLFRVTELVIVDSLPYTSSNKLMRRELRAGHVGSAGSGPETERRS